MVEEVTKIPSRNQEQPPCVLVIKIQVYSVLHMAKSGLEKNQLCHTMPVLKCETW